jgi:chemotaxis protein histidine kinase CheA
VSVSAKVEIIENAPAFDSRVIVTELLMKTLENASKDLATRCITECARIYGFNSSEAIANLGLENVNLIRKQMTKKAKKVTAAPVEKKTKKQSFPFPFIATNVNTEGCQGLAYNKGLFTQCPKKRMENGNYCNGCQTEADKSASGCPDCGTIGGRLACGLYEFRDSKGRAPVSYMKVLEKLELSKEAAMEAAGKENIIIADEHFVVVEKEKKTKKSEGTRGRPKKAPKAVEAENVDDLFAKLTADNESEDTEILEEEKAPKKVKLTEEEKAAKKAALEAEREAKKQEREAQKQAEKAEKEAMRKSEMEQKKAEKAAKLAAEKQEREAKRQQEKQEREAKKQEDKAKKGKKEQVATEATEPAAKEVAEPAPKKVSVTRIQISGKMYLKSSNNILYDPETKEEVGMYDPATKTIQALPQEEEEEEEEEEYDE